MSNAWKKLIEAARAKGSRCIALWESFPGRYNAACLGDGFTDVIMVRGANDHTDPYKAIDELEEQITPPAKLVPCPHCGEGVIAAALASRQAQSVELMATLAGGSAVSIALTACPKCAGLVTTAGAEPNITLTAVTEAMYVEQCRAQFTKLQADIRRTHEKKKNRDEPIARPANPPYDIIQHSVDGLGWMRGNLHACYITSLVKNDPLVANDDCQQHIAAFIDKCNAGPITWAELEAFTREGVRILQTKFQPAGV